MYNQLFEIITENAPSHRGGQDSRITGQHGRNRHIDIIASEINSIPCKENIFSYALDIFEYCHYDDEDGKIHVKWGSAYPQVGDRFTVIRTLLCALGDTNENHFSELLCGLSIEDDFYLFKRNEKEITLNQLREKFKLKNKRFEHTPINLPHWYDPFDGFRINSDLMEFKYWACFSYKPLNSFPVLSEIEELHRQFIWDFKNGERSEEAAKLIANCLYKKIRILEGRESLYTFCVIPASTEENTIRRFLCFTNHLVAHLKMGNGYDYIRVIEDHEATKGQKEKNVTQYLAFKEDKIKGKRIILFDDVITSGETFYQCARQLLDFGAKQVVGVFLGSTANATKKNSKCKEYLDDL